jgi:hypothetical protein
MVTVIEIVEELRQLKSMPRQIGGFGSPMQ